MFWIPYFVIPYFIPISNAVSLSTGKISIEFMHFHKVPTATQNFRKMFNVVEDS